jgi:alkanesulfonate monooxygenase SsuD/methylene tetrahydromethanopterin reductase-like flavin-dependent oxidoreductase (luciferase family)
LILRKIWTDDIAEFKAQFYNIPASKIGPILTQKQHFPVYLGGIVKETLVHIAKYADGWLAPVGGSLDILESKICRTMA